MRHVTHSKPIIDQRQVILINKTIHGQFRCLAEILYFAFQLPRRRVFHHHLDRRLLHIYNRWSVTRAHILFSFLAEHALLEGP